VNRAYYAMFYAASALLARTGRGFRKHSAVQAAFGERFAKTGALDPKYHRWLIDAFDLRTVGDYDANTIVLPADAVTLIGRAEEFLAVARGWLAGTSRAL
jgi:uncharacterized protein (UPF0332 family)